MNSVFTKNRLSAKRYCSPAHYEDKPKLVVYVIPQSSEEITIPVQQLMQDNVWSLKDDQAKAVADQIKNDPLVAKNIACGRSIQRIEVQASSSKLGNTADAQKQFTEVDSNQQVTKLGRWNFESLSKARADSFQNQVLTQLNLPGFNGANSADFSKVKVKLGENQSGSSGACPYRLVKDGNKFKVVEKDGYQTGSAIQKKLEQDNQYMRAVIRFSGEPCQSEKIAVNSRVYETRVLVDHCLEVRYQCQ